MKRLAVLLMISTLLLVLGGLWWKNGVQPVDIRDTSQKVFVIEKGTPIREIGSKLKRENLIRDPVVFFLLVKKEEKDRIIQAGLYRLSASMDLPAIVDNLTHGTLDVWITLPEGLRAEEVADILKKNFPQYDNSWREELVRSEGYLFPDTYLIPKDADIQLIISILRDNFEKKFKTLGTPKHTLSQSEVVTLASLIEREARADQDRPLVASVILNRLDLGMKLDIDATIQYALGYQEDQKSWWKKGLTTQDKSTNSPYNTYRNPGLPPGPISSPGLASLKAVINPADTNYLYYVSDSTGKNHYAETIGKHNENIKKYLSK